MPFSSQSRRWTPVVVACAQVAATAMAAAPANAASHPTVGVVIDNRPRDADIVTFERLALERLATLLAQVDADVCVVGAAAPIDVPHACGPAGRTLPDVAERLPVVGNGHRPPQVRLHDAIAESVARFDARADGQPRWIVVLAEGNDAGSTTSLAAVRQQARERGVHVFTLLSARHRGQVGRVRQFGFDLIELAHETAGEVHDVRTDVDALDRALADFAPRLRQP